MSQFFRPCIVIVPMVNYPVVHNGKRSVVGQVSKCKMNSETVFLTQP